jgi:uncharacterized protein YdhG (YjbR/CyaY superfamily)
MTKDKEQKVSRYIDPEDYIRQQPPARQQALEQLRRTIKSHLPEGFEEMMLYGMINYVVPHALYPAGYHVDPRLPLPFLALANQSRYIAIYHLGLYSDSALYDWFVAKYEALGIGKLDMGKSCIRFGNTERIPYELIAELCTRLTVGDYVKQVEAARGSASKPSPKRPLAES